MTIPNDELSRSHQSRGHRFFLYVQIWLLLVPLTALYALAVIIVLPSEIPFSEFRWLAGFLIPGVFLWAGWVIAIATVKGPRASCEVASFWWRLSAIATLAVVASVAFFSWTQTPNDSSLLQVIAACCSFGLPLLPLSMHCWYLRRRTVA